MRRNGNFNASFQILRHFCPDDILTFYAILTSSSCSCSPRPSSEAGGQGSRPTCWGRYALPMIQDCCPSLALPVARTVVRRFGVPGRETDDLRLEPTFSLGFSLLALLCLSFRKFLGKIFRT